MQLIHQTVAQLAERNQPLPLCTYIYDLPHLRARVRAIKTQLPANCELFYATKANPDRKILAALADVVDGFEVASGGELAHVTSTLPNVPIIFGGPGKLRHELQRALDHSVELIHVESLHELKQLQALAAQSGHHQDILLRMNIALDDTPLTRLAMAGRPTPFGLDEQHLPEVMQVLSDCGNLTLRGFHFHLMSHQCDADKHIQLIQVCIQRYKAWMDTYQLELDHLNVGGGFGIDYSPTAAHFHWDTFCQKLRDLVNEEDFTAHTLRFESGRYITATCGYYAAEVIDIKQNFGEYFAICRGGTHHFRTPAAQNHNHPFTVIAGRNRQRESQIEGVNVSMVGQLCTPKDVFAKQQRIEKIAIGDFVVFSLAGAYAWNISHQNFLMHEPPNFEYIEAGHC